MALYRKNNIERAFKAFNNMCCSIRPHELLCDNACIINALIGRLPCSTASRALLLLGEATERGQT